MIATCRILKSNAICVETDTWTAASTDAYTVVIYETEPRISTKSEEVYYEILIDQLEKETARYNAEHSRCPSVLDDCANGPTSKAKVYPAQSPRWSRHAILCVLARPPPASRWLATGQQAVALAEVFQWQDPTRKVATCVRIAPSALQFHQRETERHMSSESPDGIWDYLLRLGFKPIPGSPTVLALHPDSSSGRRVRLQAASHATEWFATDGFELKMFFPAPQTKVHILALIECLGLSPL